MDEVAVDTGFAIENSDTDQMGTEKGGGFRLFFGGNEVLRCARVFFLNKSNS